MGRAHARQRLYHDRPLVYQRAATEALIALAEETVEKYRTGGSTPPRVEQSGALTYRTGRHVGQRYRLTVSTTPRAEGDKPQLVRVSRA